MKTVRLHGYQIPATEELDDDLIHQLNFYAASDIAKRSMLGPLFCLAAMLICIPLSSLQQDHPTLVYSLISLLVVTALSRIWALKSSNRLTIDTIENWKLLVTISVLTTALVWGVYLAISVYFYGLTVGTVVIFAFTVAIASGASISMFIWMGMARLYVLIAFLPAYIVVIFELEYAFVTALIGIFIYVLYLMMQILRANREYWLAIYNNKLLEKRAVELKLAKENAERAREEAEQANQAKSEFLSSMSHELRTPLNVISGFTQLLSTDKNDTPTPSQAESLSYILDASGHLLELINQVLDLAKIESGNLVLKLEKIALEKPISDCIKLVTSMAEQKGIAIIGPESNDYTVYADLVRLKQVLINLLSNAIKYNKENGQITVSYEQHNDCVRLLVTDTGVGLSDKDKQRLFTSFSRLSQENSATQGSGVGLVICKRIIEAMGGHLSYESTEGVGSTFWFDLPSEPNK